MIHLYSITNIRPATVDKAEVTFVWPYATLSGDDLLYLLEAPVAKYSDGTDEEPQLSCTSIIANKQNYLVSFKTLRWKHLQHFFFPTARQEPHECLGGRRFLRHKDLPIRLRGGW